MAVYDWKIIMELQSAISIEMGRQAEVYNNLLCVGTCRGWTMSESRLKIALEEALRSRAIYLSLMQQSAAESQREFNERDQYKEPDSEPGEGIEEPPESG